MSSVNRIVDTILERDGLVNGEDSIGFRVYVKETNKSYIYTKNGWMEGSTLSGDGNLPVPEVGMDNEGKVLTAGDEPGEMTWQNLPEDKDTTYTPFDNNTDGLVPAPALTNTDNMFLCADGTWKENYSCPEGLRDGYVQTGKKEGTEMGKYATAEGLNNISSNFYAHAEGFGTKSTGVIAHAEGNCTEASANNTHAEGENSKASAQSSHAEGILTEASGSGSHSEGYRTKATTANSHAEGENSETNGRASHAEGYHTFTRQVEEGEIDNSQLEEGVQAAHSEGYNTQATGIASHVEGFGTVASGASSHCEGQLSQSTGISAHAEGTGNSAYGEASHAEGASNEANGPASHAEGYGTVSGEDETTIGSHAEGFQTKATSSYSHAEGYMTQVTGTAAHAAGMGCIASGGWSYANGYYTLASAASQFVIGSYNVEYKSSAQNAVNNDALFIIGNGTSSARSNAFRVNKAGIAFGKGAYATSGADYCEYFEWKDGNPNNEDRRGLFVTLDEDKIVKATSTDDFILGIISATPTVIGNDFHDEWKNKYLRDEFGVILTKPEMVKVDMGDGTFDEVEMDVPIINPDFDPNKEYIPRNKRKEWSPVGLVGQLLVRDDGTCKPNGYCKPTDGGIATNSDTGYRVLKRINDHLVKIYVSPITITTL